MFAIIKTGGKQYKVSPGDIIKVEKIASDTGAQINFSSIMMIGDNDTTTLGSPLLNNTSVNATVLEQKRSRKIIIYKKKRRQGYDRKNGHRQHLSVLHIDEILQNGKSLAKADPHARETESAGSIEYHPDGTTFKNKAVDMQYDVLVTESQDKKKAQPTGHEASKGAEILDSKKISKKKNETRQQSEDKAPTKAKTKTKKTVSKLDKSRTTVNNN